ncbi:MAG: hypothetical protein ACLFUJ_16785 [Phycisphaerae bacterium]
MMTKRELIDTILTYNTSADAGFLAQFTQRELTEYLQALIQARAAHAKASPQRRAGAVAGFRGEPRTQAEPAMAPASAFGPGPQAVSVELTQRDFILPGQGKLF